MHDGRENIHSTFQKYISIYVRSIKTSWQQNNTDALDITKD